MEVFEFFIYFFLHKMDQCLVEKVPECTPIVSVQAAECSHLNESGSHDAVSSKLAV